MVKFNFDRSEDFEFSTEQKQLKDALVHRDLEEFQLAIEMGADPLIPNNNGVCVYEMALSTYGCKEYVEECIINTGCSPYYINQRLDKAAINYAVESMDPEIIRVLLLHPNIEVNFSYYYHTPLTYLADNVSDDNVDEVSLCMKSLIQYGASSIIPDVSGKTPTTYLMQNNKLSQINRRRISQMFGELSKNNKKVTSTRPSRSTFIICSESVKEPEMALYSTIEDVAPELSGDEYAVSDLDDAKSSASEIGLEKINLFFNSIEYKDNISFNKLMAEGIDCNEKLYGRSPLQCALSSGNCHALKQLLHHKAIDIKSAVCPLSQVIRNMQEESGNYRKCFYILLKSGLIDINEADDTGSTALHYAVESRNNEAINNLLKRGAFLGAKNDDNVLAINNMRPEVLEECFDSCISENKHAMGESTLRIAMNYDNLRLNSNHPDSEFQKVMPSLAFMAKSEDHRYLLEHPLITSFLRLKWKQFSPIFYINLLFYLFFAFSFVAYVILRFGGSDATKTMTALRIISWLGIVYMIIRESLQMITLPRQYFRSVTNYMELILIGLAIVTCRGDTQIDRQTQKVLAVVTMLLIAVELFVICGSLPILSMSVHMQMLQAVCISFLKSFFLYSIFVVTFSFCFYILFGIDRSKASGEGDFNKFTSPLRSIVKTIVMLTGEYDAASLEFTSTYSYVLFLLFVFLMTIVLYNLLNGLAVSDIQTIMGQAKQNGTICRIDLLTGYEDVVTGHPLYHRLMNLYSVTTDQTDFSENIHKMDRETIEEALYLLEQKKLESIKQKRKRNTENRLTSIENKLTELFKRLDAK